jgi:protein-L-isoaspartate(D-aspartate) O-methyltransferase
VEAERAREEARFARARQRLAERLAGDGIRDARVLKAIAEVPRHLLVADAFGHQAYQDAPLPIGEGQTISAPGIVAAMSEALELRETDRVLEIGTGSGYQAALLARLAERVISIERIPTLALRAENALRSLGVRNVAVNVGDGTRGWPGAAPFDAILVTAGGPDVPPPLLEQLAPRGRLVGPFGRRGAQTLVRVRHEANGRFTSEALGRCRFVDLVGEHGYPA